MISLTVKLMEDSKMYILQGTTKPEDGEEFGVTFYFQEYQNKEIAEKEFNALSEVSPEAIWELFERIKLHKVE
jgi:hypothetical protein